MTYDLISREHLLSEIDELMKSPWFNNGKDDDTFAHYGYVERKEAVEIVRDLCVKTEPTVFKRPCSNCANEDSLKLFDNLPSVTPERQKREWIPVTEGLPKNEGTYLIIKSIHDCNSVDICYFDGEDFIDKYGIYNDVTAWMPLPEPYKEVLNDNN